MVLFKKRKFSSVAIEKSSRIPKSARPQSMKVYFDFSKPICVYLKYTGMILCLF